MSSTSLRIPDAGYLVESSRKNEDCVIESTQFIAAIVESSEDAIIGEDLHGLITSWNRGAEKMFGYSSMEAIGQSVSILHSLGDSEELAAILALIRSGKCASHFETTRRRKDGTRIDVSISVSPVYSKDGTVVGGAKIIRDITDRKRSEELLRKTEQLGIANRLAVSVAHEINNPLAALTNLLYLMRGTALSPQAVQFLGMAEQELARVSHITTQALGFYKETTSAAAYDLAKVLDEALSLHSHRIETQGIRVEKRYQNVNPIVCHGGELRQVFVNLIGNAIEAMPHAGMLKLRVRAASSARTHTTGVRVTVADSGCGMPPDALDHLFEPFYTTRGPIKTGLGLWMCREIVTRHRGTIWVRSSEALERHGTVFALFLPSHESHSHLETERSLIHQSATAPQAQEKDASGHASAISCMD